MPLTIDHFPCQLQAILDHTNEQGIVSWSHPKFWLQREGIMDAQDAVYARTLDGKRALADYMFGQFPLYIKSRIPNSSAPFIRKLAPTVLPHPTQDATQVLLQAHTCALLGLPGHDPKAELDKIRGFFRSMKDALDTFYAVYPDEDDAHATFFLNHSPAGTTQSLSLYLQGAIAPTDRAVLEQVRDTLQTQLQTDPILMAFHRHVRRLIHAMGPDAFIPFSDRHFYDPLQSPSEQRRLRCAALEPEQEADRMT